MISVIVPVYNGQKYIEKTIGSILASDYQDIEVIAVNDGSTDESEEIICKLAEMDGRIKYYYKENGGIVSARNYGLERVNGEYVCFVDQDDVVLEDMYSLLISDIQSGGVDFAQGGNAQLINDEIVGLCDRKENVFIEKGTEKYEQNLGALIFRSGIKCVGGVDAALWNKVFRTKFLKNNHINFFRFLDYEDDWLFAIEALHKAERVSVCTKTVYAWRVNMESESHNRKNKDVYIDNFYVKHCNLKNYLLTILNELNISENLYNSFCGELQKETLLWGLSNETGRGITGRCISESTEVMKKISSEERKNGWVKGMLWRFHPISVYGQHGIRKLYHQFRDVFLTVLLMCRMEYLAVVLNKKILHGRWHI